MSTATMLVTPTTFSIDITNSKETIESLSSVEYHFSKILYYNEVMKYLNILSVYYRIKSSRKIYYSKRYVTKK